MALSLNITPQININDELYILEDTTGSYDAASNTGGYGSPNPDRSDVALLVYALDRTGSSDIVFSPISYDPVTVTKIQFNADKSKDRYIRAHVFAVLIETGSESTGDYYWNAADGLTTIRRKTAGGYDSIALSTVVDVADIVQKQVDSFVSMYSSNTLINVIQKKMNYAMASVKDCYNPSLEELQKDYRNLYNQINAGNYNLVNENFAYLKEIINGINTWIGQHIYYG